MPTIPASKLALTTSACAALLLLSGCIISGSNRSYSRGTHVPEYLLSSFEPGYTPYAEIEETLGVPSRTINRPDGSVVLVYEYTKVKDEEAGLLFVFHAETYHETTRTTFIELIDGIYERAWTESST